MLSNWSTRANIRWINQSLSSSLRLENLVTALRLGDAQRVLSCRPQEQKQKKNGLGMYATGCGRCSTISYSLVLTVLVIIGKGPRFFLPLHPILPLRSSFRFYGLIFFREIAAKPNGRYWLRLKEKKRVLRVDRPRWEDLRRMVFGGDFALHEWASLGVGLSVSLSVVGAALELFTPRAPPSSAEVWNHYRIKTKNFDLRHLLRGRGHLRPHHRHRFGRSDRAVHPLGRGQRWQHQEEELVRRIHHVRSRDHHRHRQPYGLRHLRRPGWIGGSPGGRRWPHSFR